jgi:beta-glucanase (GH16 family)
VRDSAGHLSSGAIFAMDAHRHDPSILPLPGFRLAWSDDFEGSSLSTKDWEYRTDTKMWSTQLSENVSVSESCVHLGLKKEARNGRNYTGAGVISRRTFGYGYFEARFRVPPGSGWHTSFWLMTHDGSGSTDPRDSALELDICEQDSVNVRQYTLNFHRWQGDHLERGFTVIPTPDLSADYHVWGCHFTANKVTWYFEGNEVRQIDISDMPFKEMHLWLTSIASPLGETPHVDDAALPAEASFDWVRYYQPAE